MKKIIYTLSLLLMMTCSFAFISATTTSIPKLTDYPWAALVYWGRMTNNDLLAINYTLTNETLYSTEISHQLSEQNIFRRFFQPIVTTMEVAGNITYRNDPVGPIYEFIPYFDLRWANFPWQRYIATSIAVGEGLSYVTQVPEIEQSQSSVDRPPQKLLNYIMVEVTFALPKHPQWELVARIHHRSGVFGLYNAENTGSTAIGLGVRYRF